MIPTLQRRTLKPCKGSGLPEVPTASLASRCQAHGLFYTALNRSADPVLRCLNFQKPLRTALYSLPSCKGSEVSSSPSGMYYFPSKGRASHG